MTPYIRLSVALLTRDKPDSLARCLASLRAQEAQPYEVVVSDDSSGEGTASDTRDVVSRFGCRYVAGPKRGLYANRNSAALQCTGTHIRTMDDDHTFPAGHFAQCLAAVKSDPAAIWTTGETCIMDGKLFGGMDMATQLHPSGVGGPVDNPDHNWAIADGSTIYPREIFDAGLRMVEDFGYGSSYLEFGAFLYKRGFRSRCTRGARVEHHAGKDTLSRDNPRSRIFACLCYNLHFRRNLPLAARYLAPAFLRRPYLVAEVSSMLENARLRWTPGI